jgi:CRP/FNR family cyclic AMP-dependent transcriptional regulator
VSAPGKPPKATPAPEPEDVVNVNDEATAALRGSNLRGLSRQSMEELLAVARTMHARGGDVLHWTGDPRPHLELLVSGLVRVFVLAPDGRTLTVRYVRPGGLMGALSLYAPEYALPATTQAVVESRVLAFPAAAVTQAAATDPEVAHALLIELSERVKTFVDEIAWGAFASVRQRVARRLLDLAAEDIQGPEVVARISQAQLAAECGTVRSVVVRELQKLRAQGLVATRRDMIAVLDPAGLLAESSPS